MDKRRKLSKKKTRFREVAPIPETIEAFLKTTQTMGQSVRNLAYDTSPLTSLYGYKYLMKKYKSKCIVPGVLRFQFLNNELDYVIDWSFIRDALILGHHLKLCIDAGVSAIFIPLVIIYKSKQPADPAHANMLIYRPFNRTIERFEPHFDNLVAHDENNNSQLNQRLQHLFEDQLRDELGKYVPKYSVYVPLCPNTHQSFQQLDESFRDQQRVEEGGGYCQMWSLLIMECILIQPDLSTDAIVKKIFVAAGKDPTYFRKLMRGYVCGMSIGTEAAYGANLKNRGSPLTRAKRNSILRNSVQLADLYNKRSLREKKNEGSASSHSSDFQDSRSSSGLAITDSSDRTVTED